MKRHLYWFIALLTTIVVFVSHQRIGLAILQPTQTATTQTKSTQFNLIDQTIFQGQQHYDTGAFRAAVELWQQALTQSPTPLQQIRLHNYLAIAYQDLNQWSQAKRAIAQAKILLTQHPDSLLQAQQLNIQATLALNLGQPDRAYTLWQQAETQYKSLNDQFGQQLSQLNQSQALQNLGHYRQARTHLERLQQSLKPDSDALLQAKTRLSLGTTLQMLVEL
ncbi:hypothetical protein IQ266_20530, partial [filamentous cyanobacterium LEGE 11480]|nr:hypothetical protein [Romeriopsis navalis LEGE 11480]